MKSQNSIFAVTIPLSNISQKSTTISACKVIQIHVILEKKKQVSLPCLQTFKQLQVLKRKDIKHE